jgi:hypothetical protein
MVATLRQPLGGDVEIEVDEHFANVRKQGGRRRGHDLFMPAEMNHARRNHLHEERFRFVAALTPISH